ncbi:MAG: PDZ domain-containing protein [Proteobacteria bacterium]|nr:PDZ domain-containing protein [Pseudomonadota bacterium]
MNRISWLMPLFFMAAVANQASAAGTCVNVGQWLRPADQTTVKHKDLIAELAERPVVLLGEVHIENEHHRWQLHTLAALHAKNSNMVIAFESFPRSTQPALDRWVKGDLSIKEFLKQSRWNDVWRFDPNYYLPLFHFARQHKIPMVAMNVERSLIRAVGKKGFQGVPIEDREGVSKPASVPEPYRKSLKAVFDLHQKISAGSPHKPTKQSEQKTHGTPQSDKARFGRFVEVQSTWDRAMAEAIFESHKKDGSPLVVGIVGMGHLEFGYGIPHQLKDLGIHDAAVLLPWGPNRTCADLNSPEGTAIANVVFGTKPVLEAANRPRPKLGVMISTESQKVIVNNVLKDSLAAVAGIKNGDIIIKAAEIKVQDTAAFIAIIQRQAPGTWLPLTLVRDGREIDIVAKFPAQKKN